MKKKIYQPIYQYHSECGTFYSLTDRKTLELNEANQKEVNDILYIRTNGYSEDRSYPYHVVIDSKEEMNA